MASSKNKKGLGRGIDAIFSEFEAIDENSETVVDLSIDDIRPNPYQPRKTFDQNALNELAHSIEQNGVFQPIIVRESVNGFEIIAGERRFRASKIQFLFSIRWICITFSNISISSFCNLIRDFNIIYSLKCIYNF